MNKDWLVLVNRLSSRMKRNAQSCRNVSFSAFHMPSIIGTTLLGSSLIDTDIQKTCCWLDCQAASCSKWSDEAEFMYTSTESARELSTNEQITENATD